MGFVSWLTGRNDLYADKDKIETVIEQLQTIKSHDIESAKEELGEAIKELNSCTGFQQYVCNTINTNSFDEVIDASGVAIDSLVSNIEGKVDDMKEYSDSGLIKKAFSTYLMANAKFGEGILSVFEDLGDGAVSVLGWVAPKDSGLEKWCKKFVEKEWSHDAFNFYYKSNLAKASLFTEDSALASGFKIAGSVSGYLALGGAISGVGGVAANSGSKILKAAGTFASSTTRVNTVTAALTGMGSGTEAGLRKGLDFDKAAVKGAKQAAVQGALAYGAGKLGESIQKKNAIKAAENNADDLASEVTKAEDVLKSKEASHVAATKETEAAAKEYDVAKQSYDDAIARQNVYDEPNAAYSKALKNKLSQEKELEKLTDQLKNAKDKDTYDAIYNKVLAKNNSLEEATKTLDDAKAALDKVGKQTKSSYEANVLNINNKASALNKAEETFNSSKNAAAVAKGEKVAAQEATWRSSSESCC